MRLQFSNVAKVYAGANGKVGALEDVTFALEGGDFTAVQGPSGCGKSTLLLVAGGLLRPDAGQVDIDAADLYSMSAEQRADFRAANIGFVFQQFHLVPYLNVLDNVLAAANLHQNGDVDYPARAAELLERFGLSGRSKHVPAALSTGERQRTALARALLNEPKILLADEPTGNLDDESAGIVLDHLAQFAIAGGAVLLVTHDRDAASRAGRQITMKAGRVLVKQPAAASQT